MPLLSSRSLLFILTALITMSPAWGALQSSSSPASPITVSVTQTCPSTFEIAVSVDEFVRASIPAEGLNWDYISLKDEPLIAREGWPDLPFIARAVLIPAGSHPRLVINKLNQRFENNVLPAPFSKEFYSCAEDRQECLSYQEDDRLGCLSYGEDFMRHDGLWPPQPVELGEPAILRGYSILPIRIFPVQYNYQNREMTVNESVSFSLEFDAPVNPTALHPAPEYQSLYAWRAVEALVENPPAPPRDDLLSANYLYIVPEFEGVDSVLTPLIEWRKRQGHKVQVEHVANNAAAADIMNVIRAAYAGAAPVEFVALVGDVNGQGMRLAAMSVNGDYGYTQLDGNDPLPDVALGRISAQTLDQLGIIVNKLVSYEATPFMGNTDWYLHGCVVAGSSTNGLSEIFNAKYVRRELLALGFTEVRHWYHDVDGNIGGNQPFLTDAFDWGISVLHYRAYQMMNGLQIAIIENLPNRDGRWPAVLAISCDTGDFTNQDGRTEAFLRARGGGIGAIGTATAATLVQYNNMMAAGVWRGVYKMKLYAFGWGLNFGKYELWRAYEGFDNTYSGFMDWNNLMGDPGTHIWTGIPRRIAAQYPQQIALGESHFRVTVTDQQNGNPEPGALVCLYKPDETHLTAYTDDQGVTDFYIDPEAVTPGELLVTVTKHNVHPHLGASQIAGVDHFLGTSGWEIEDDNDALPNPGESLVLHIDVSNFSDTRPNGRITVDLESLTDAAEVTSDLVILNQAPAVGESARCDFEVEINPEATDNQQLLFQITATNGQETWQSGVSLRTAGAVLTVIAQRPNPAIERGRESDLNLDLANIGAFSLPAFEAALTSDDEMVEIIRSVSRYQALAPNEDAFGQDPGFRVRINPFAIPGSMIPLRVTGEGEFGARLEAVTMLQIGRPRLEDPFGPDKYGYICFDSGDQDWQVAPEYRWVEIDPNADNPQFQGNQLDLQDVRDDQDVSLAMDLPFPFRYYGEEFNRITICTNGWAAFGDQSELADFRNRHIAQAEGPNAQLAVWWDNLITREGSAILTYYDEEPGRFIIEWNHLFRLLDGGAAGAVETFQVILFDPAVTPTLTGDGIITYQYKEVTNENRPARNDTPYCTIGIGNLDDSDGLEYTYWNTYPAGAPPIANEMAITFTTTISFTTGVIRGQVVDAANNQPIPEARLTFSRGQRAQADNNGFYQTEVLIGDNISLTASAAGYLDSTRTGLAVAEDETLTVNFGLLHPEFSPSVEDISVALDQNDRTSRQFNISNDGNGPLTWSSELTYEVGEAGIHQRVESLIVGRNVNDLDLEGAVFVNG
ncbi:MAG: C25 family cysteine peptidase, partial [Calditrichota bacterium]